MTRSKYKLNGWMICSSGTQKQNHRYVGFKSSGGHTVKIFRVGAMKQYIDITTNPTFRVGVLDRFIDETTNPTFRVGVLIGADKLWS